MDIYHYIIIGVSLVIITTLTILYVMKNQKEMKCSSQCPEQKDFPEIPKCPDIAPCPNIEKCPDIAPCPKCPACKDCPQKEFCPDDRIFVPQGSHMDTSITGPKIHVKAGNSSVTCQEFCTNKRTADGAYVPGWGVPYQYPVWAYNTIKGEFMNPATGISDNTICGCINN
jgi:hypothetical protein